MRKLITSSVTTPLSHSSLLHQKVKVEHKEEAIQDRQLRRSWDALLAVYGLRGLGLVERRRLLKLFWDSSCFVPEKISRRDLASAYWIVSAEHEKKHKEATRRRTAEELLALETIVSITERGIIPNFLVGQKAIDLFVPAFYDPLTRTCGLGIEVNGLVHEKCPGKWQKDLSKLDLMSDVGATVTWVPNCGVDKPRFKRFINELKMDLHNRKEAHTDIKARVMARIQIVSIVSSGTAEDIQKTFGCTRGDLMRVGKAFAAREHLRLDVCGFLASPSVLLRG